MIKAWQGGVRGAEAYARMVEWRRAWKAPSKVTGEGATEDMSTKAHDVMMWADDVTWHSLTTEVLSGSYSEGRPQVVSLQ